METRCSRVERENTISKIDFFLENLSSGYLAGKEIRLSPEKTKLDDGLRTLVLSLHYVNYSGLATKVCIDNLLEVVWIEGVKLVMKKIPILSTQW